MGDGAQQVTSDTTEILDEAMHRQEALRRPGGCESSPLPLALSRRLVRHRRAMVLVLPGAVYDRRHRRPVRGRVAAPLIRDHASRHAALSFQQLPKEPRRGLPIAPRLHEDVDDLAVLVDRSPHIVLRASDIHE